MSQILQKECITCKQYLFKSRFNLDKFSREYSEECKACIEKHRQKCANLKYYQKKKLEENARKMGLYISKPACRKKQLEEDERKMGFYIAKPACRKCCTCQKYLPGAAYHTARKYKYYNCKTCEAMRLREFRLKKRTGYNTKSDNEVDVDKEKVPSSVDSRMCFDNILSEDLSRSPK